MKFELTLSEKLWHTHIRGTAVVVVVPLISCFLLKVKINEFLCVTHNFDGGGVLFWIFA
jgi:hypothetical protein